MEHPFYYDTCWDLWRTVDYLVTRPDIDPDRLGMIGFSMGGIQTWLAASVDERIKVAVPAIGVQSFRWSLENGQWQGPGQTLPAPPPGAAQGPWAPQGKAQGCPGPWEQGIPR